MGLGTFEPRRLGAIQIIRDTNVTLSDTVPQPPSTFYLNGGFFLKRVTMRGGGSKIDKFT